MLLPLPRRPRKRLLPPEQAGMHKAIFPTIQERMCVRPMRNNFWMLQY